MRDDLDFARVRNDEPKVLTKGQIDQYNELGFIHPFRIYSEVEAVRNRAYLDYLLAELSTFNDGRNQYAINGYHERCEGIYDIATNRSILDIVEDIVGPNIICWGTHYFVKRPSDPKSVPWHQDASYWPLSPARTVTVWLAIDDATIRNSAMQVVPKTHNLGHITWEETAQDAVLGQEIRLENAWRDPEYLELSAGEISLHADMIVHGSAPNASAIRRAGLTLRYCPPEVKPLKEGWGAHSIICRGSDPTRIWTHHPRPRGNDLSEKGVKHGSN